MALLGADRRSRERAIRWAVSSLDVKLGLRLLMKHPGLSAVSILGMAVAVAIGATYLVALGAMIDPELPFEGGDRVVALRNLDTRSVGVGRGATVQDFVGWRDGLRSLREVGAFRDDRRNLISADGSTALVRVAEMSASGFTLARARPLLGRPLLAEDERPGSAPVVVVGHDEWKRRFGGDERLLGRTLRLDETAYTVVGVMPQGFAFPVDHHYWVPLQLPAVPEPPGSGSLEVFGRLAEGVRLEEARAELATAGRRLAEAQPHTHAHLRPHLFYYPHAFVGVKDNPELEAEMRAVRQMAGLALLVVAMNVAVLVYARTATRAGEIAVRTALGASRGRVVTQLFVEALVLSAMASVLGLGVARLALRFMNGFVRQEHGPDAQYPFWLQLGLTPGVVLHVAVLAVVAAAIVGVLPALALTGRRVQSGLQRFAARAAAVDPGRTWTALIVLQVAVAVVGLPAGVKQARDLYGVGTREPAPVADRLMQAHVVMARPSLSRPEGPLGAVEAGDRQASRVTSLLRRLEEDPEIVSVALAERLPGEEFPSDFELEPVAGAAATDLITARTNHVGATFFQTYEVPALAGRALTAADSGTRSVVVDQTFADRVGGPVVGRRIRSPENDQSAGVPGPWYEIVGVVPAFAHRVAVLSSNPLPRVFHAATPADLLRPAMVVRLRSAPSPQAAARLRDLAASVDPSLRLERLQSVAEAWHAGQRTMRLVGLAIITVLLSALALSAAGIYAMMSFTVTRRRREIGIRCALGADARGILAGVFARASTQLGGGVLAGLAVAGGLDLATGGEVLGGDGRVLLPLAGAVMVAVGLLASLGPARRGLRVQPTEALREE